MSPFILALVRHLLTAAGAAAATKYGIDGDTVNTIVAGATAAAGLGLSFYDKRAK